MQRANGDIAQNRPLQRSVIFSDYMLYISVACQIHKNKLKIVSQSIKILSALTVVSDSLIAFVNIFVKLFLLEE